MKKEFLKYFQLGWEALLDIIFPVFCLGCGKEGDWICPECFKRIKPETRFICRLCGHYSDLNIVCDKCAKKSFIDRFLAAALYDENKVLQKAIHAYKYKFISSLSRPIAKVLIAYLENYFKAAGIDKRILAVPVPLHRKRLSERGFNQAELLAMEVTAHFGLEFADILKRTAYTSAQARLDEAARAENVRDAFRVCVPERARGRKILLVDDVFTTGATMQECARALKKAGAKEVWGAAAAKG